MLSFFFIFAVFLRALRDAILCHATDVFDAPRQMLMQPQISGCQRRVAFEPQRDATRR